MTSHQHADTKVLAYQAIVDFFLDHEDDVIEIEILPPVIHPTDGLLLQEGLNLGIPKSIFVLAFVEARRLFWENITDNRMSSEALMATKVILLFDPEYITAAHFRKRRILALKQGISKDKTIYCTALKQELCFLNTILTSPLHRQSKSPTLWHHRLWLVDLIVDSEFEDAVEEQKDTFWRAEIDAVCKSGEQHPKNYYAWQYARRLMTKIGGLDTNDEFTYCVKDWCFKHPSDISGWSFLLFLLPRVRPPAKRQQIVGEVFKYAINLRAEQESLWMFIRTVISHETLYGSRLENYQTLQNYRNELAKNENQSAITERISQTLRWVSNFGEPISASDTTHST